MLWREVQSQFAMALCDESAELPANITTAQGKLQHMRFNVYRNNVAVSLSEALAAGYPIVKRLVGDEFFYGMASVYVSRTIPSSPVMLYYGADFPEFIAEFEPAAQLPFLADVAEIEWAWHSAYHAADCEPVSFDQLQAIPPERLETIRFHLHP